MDNNVFDSEFLINGLRELEPVIFYKDIEARYVFSNHYKEETKYDNGHHWDVYGKTDLECREDIENAIRVHECDLEMMKTGEKAKYVIKKMINGEMSYLEIQKSPVYKNGEIVGIVGLIVDITEKVKLKMQLEKLANTDQLTGLYNRNYLKSWLENQNDASLYPLTLISADCNYLKQMNDIYGHLIGDEYIKMIANLFNFVLPKDSIKFRTGGDEFLILLPNTSYEKGIELIQKLKREGFEYSIKNQPLSVSYGLSTMKEYQEKFDKYINEADKNMYIDKERNHKVLMKRKK